MKDIEKQLVATIAFNLSVIDRAIAAIGKKSGAFEDWQTESLDELSEATYSLAEEYVKDNKLQEEEQ